MGYKREEQEQGGDNNAPAKDDDKTHYAKFPSTLHMSLSLSLLFLELRAWKRITLKRPSERQI